MLLHHFLIAIRNFKRNKSSFFINLTGLTAGLTCTLLIYLWVNSELETDKFHQKTERLFQVMEHQQYAEGIMTTTSTPGILSEALKDEIPEVEYAATATWINKFTLSVEGQENREKHNVKAEGYYVGEDYFNIFSYELLQGDKDQVLTDKSSIVISEELSLKLFNTTEDVIGRTVTFQHEEQYKVSGVFKELPATSSYQFDFVLSFEVFKADNRWVREWDNNGPSTFLVLNKNANAKEVSDKIADFVKQRVENSNVTLFLQPYAERYLYGSFENGVQSGGRIEYVRLFSVVAIFILLIACINFMNLSTAMATKRAREVGIKKTIGARQRSLVFQYLSESVAITFLALLLALSIVGLILPKFSGIVGKEVIFPFDFGMVLGLLAIAVFTGVVAGSYPALYLSNFSPVKVLKGQVRGRIGEIWARKGLVIFQFTISVSLIVSVVVVYKQIEFIQSKNLGYDKENVVYSDVEGKLAENLEPFIAEVKKVPGVVNASSISHHLIGRQSNTSGLEWEGKDPDMRVLFENVAVNDGLIETMGITLKEGRAFSAEYSTDTSKIIFNEAAIKVMGLEDPIGKIIRLWDEEDMEIIGVVKDFHFQSLREDVNPLFFLYRPQYTWNVMVRLQGGREKEVLESLGGLYQTFNPGFAFDYRFLDESYQKQYVAEQRVAALSKYFAALAILISCLGLYGLAAFTMERRLKEIGVRKVFGSSVLNIIYLMSGEFTRLVVMSIAIALPLSYFLINDWLGRFAYRIGMEIWFFAGAGLAALLVAWVTVGMHALKAARINPVDCLKER